MFVDDLRHKHMLERVDRVIVNIDRRVGGEVDVGLQGCNHKYLMRSKHREILPLSKLWHRTKLLVPK